MEIESRVLARAGGVGGFVAPLMGPPGAGVRVEDVATLFDGDLCDCNDLAADGFDDVVIKFSTQAMVNIFELGSKSHRASVTLTVRGSLLDGTEFEASDCVVITGRASETPQRAIRKHGKQKPRD